MQGGLLLTKYEQVARMILDDIEAGKFPRGRIPREVDLVKQLGVSRRTVNRALTELAGQGVIRRFKRRGTFVTGTDGSLRVTRQVGVILPQDAHFYGTLNNAVVRELCSRELFAVNMRGPDYRMGQAELTQAMSAVNRFLASACTGVLYFGDGYHLYPILDAHPGVRSVALVAFTGKGDVPHSAVLADYEAGARAATAYLTKMGHENVALVTYQPRELADMPAVVRERHPVVLYRQGYERGMRESGNAARIRVLDGLMHGPDMEREVAQFLLTGNRPSAILCMADWFAGRIMRVAHGLGLRIPEDLSLVGLLNTPWCEDSLVPLTSVSLNEEKIARKAVCLVAAGDRERVSCKVRPRLVVRGSCDIRRRGR